ncbi:MAG: cysteine--tRNA ligase, partial [Maritimibacter sp.]
ETYGADHVTYVRNITDVDDKINARALRDYPDLPLNEAIRKVTDKTEKQYLADVAALGCLEPNVQPRATENITQMTDIIQALIDKGNAYIAEGGEGREVLFSVPSMDDYGQLSKRKQEDQQAGARIAVEAHKKNPSDFVLWKESAADEPGWQGAFTVGGESVAIHGRPGWHIECSAMSKRYLGETFDIHGGGLDLIFPHHENEIAQSRCAHGTDVMANVWMHNGFLQVEGKKMSKSEGKWPQGLEPEGEVHASILEALADDLNTVAAIQALHALANADSPEFAASANLLGLLPKKAEISEVLADSIDSIIQLRLEMIKAKNWAEADKVRDDLAAKGVLLKDGKDPETGERVTTWEVKR